MQVYAYVGTMPIRSEVSMDRGWSVLEADAPLGRLARAYRMPCCTFVALWILEAQGQEVVPLAPDWAGPEAYAAAIRAAASLDPAWWRRANVAETPPRPWSALSAAEERGGRLVTPRLVSRSMPAPELTPGRWHVIQRWRDPMKLVGGHAYLVRAGETSASEVQVVQSSEAKGFRVSPGSWDGTAGLMGYHVGAVVLPAMGTP